MIIPEERLDELFATLPAMSIGGESFTPYYDFGTQPDLYKFLNLKRKEVNTSGSGNIYPIIWMPTEGLTLQGDHDKRIRFRLSLVLATLTTSEQTNKDRIDLAFKTVLHPLWSNIERALKYSGFTKLIRTGNNVQDEVLFQRYFNYSTDNDENHDTTDIWDALRVETELEMTSGCLRSITY